jgi:hypothetical protein
VQCPDFKPKKKEEEKEKREASKLGSLLGGNSTEAFPSVFLWFWDWLELEGSSYPVPGRQPTFTQLSFLRDSCLLFSGYHLG